MTRARELADLISSGVIEATELADNAITNAKLADDAVDSAEIAAGAIDTVHIAASQITNALMADDAIDSDEIAAGAIDFAHMSVNSINSDQYVDGSIDTAHIANNAITAVKIDSAVELGGPSLGSSSIIRTNAQTISENITVPATGTTGNAMSVGPIGIADTYTIILAGIWCII